MSSDTQNRRGAAGQMNGRKDKLVADIGTVVTDAENLLQRTKNAGVEGYATVRSELEGKLSDTVARLHEVQEELKFRARFAVRSTDVYVRENPWRSVAIVAAAGIIVGLFLSRRR